MSRNRVPYYLQCDRRGGSLLKWSSAASAQEGFDTESDLVVVLPAFGGRTTSDMGTLIPTDF